MLIKAHTDNSILGHKVIIVFRKQAKILFIMEIVCNQYNKYLIEVVESGDFQSLG